MVKSRDSWCLFWKFVTFTLFDIKVLEKSLSFDCVPLLLPKLLAKNLEPGGKHPHPQVLMGLSYSYMQVNTEATKSQRNRRRQGRIEIFLEKITFEAWKIHVK